MWWLLPRRLQVLAIVVAAFVILQSVVAVTDFLAGGEASAWRSAWRFASIVASIIVVILAPLANLLWRPIWRWFPKVEHLAFPDLNGTWKGMITTTWIAPGTEITPPPIRVTVSIRQSLFSTTVGLRSDGATSQSKLCRLEADRPAGIFRILYLYDYRPKATVRARSARHDGFARLELHIDENRNRLVGEYFTDRQTTGEMELSRVSAPIAVE